MVKRNFVVAEKHMPGTAPGHPPHIVCFTLQKSLVRGSICPHFTQEVIEIQEGYVTCSRSQSWFVAEEEESKRGLSVTSIMNAPLYLTASQATRDETGAVSVGEILTRQAES